MSKTVKVTLTFYITDPDMTEDQIFNMINNSTVDELEAESDDGVEWIWECINTNQS